MLATLLLLLAPASDTPAIAVPQPTIDPTALAVTDIDGQTHAVGPAEAVVVVFLKTGCPVANYYHPTLRRLAVEWGDRVRLIQVHASGRVTAADARSHRDEYDVAGVVAVDPSQSLARALDAEITPEAFVLTPDGRVHYRGRIDDTYVGFGRRRQTVGDRTLADAVDAVLAGRPVETPRTDAVGCRIHYAAEK